MSESISKDGEHLGAALLRLSEANDFVSWRILFAPDGVIWHNTDLTDKDPDDVIEGLIPIRASATSWKYDVVERVDTETGFFQRFVLNAEVGGKKVTLAAALSCETKDGLITRLDEYLDSAVFGQLVAG